MKPFVAAFAIRRGGNASIMVEPETESPVIFFEQGLFQFTYKTLLCWLPGLCHPFQLLTLYRDEALAHHRGPVLQFAFEASESFAGSLYTYVVSGTPRRWKFFHSSAAAQFAGISLFAGENPTVRDGS